MSDLNTVCISGRLVRDPIARGGGLVAALSLASNRHYVQDDEWVEEVTFIDVTAFGPLAARCIRLLAKGAIVNVQGRLELNRYQAADGSIRQNIRIVAQTITAPAFVGRSLGVPVGDTEPQEPNVTPISTRRRTGTPVAAA